MEHSRAVPLREVDLSSALPSDVGGLPGTQARAIFRLQHLSAAFCEETKDGNQSMSTMERVVATEPFFATALQGARVIEKWYRFQWFESLVAIWI